jgi:soluble lytic murein transglycosylase-like protein
MTVLKALLDASRQYGVDPGLAFSVAWAESTLKPWARSRRDRVVDGKVQRVVIARGLMQISVQYQDELVREFLGWHPSAFDWRNPVHSAKLGCAMLAAYVKRFGTWGAVASYNAGRGRYMELWKGRQLPGETQNYLKKVLG